MAESFHRETAEIYQFPIRDRTTRSAKHGESPRKVADLAMARLPHTDFGSGWYHEAAVQEAEQSGKRQPR